MELNTLIPNFWLEDDIHHQNKTKYSTNQQSKPIKKHVSKYPSMNPTNFKRQGKKKNMNKPQ